jgi:hypothetical protein
LDIINTGNEYFVLTGSIEYIGDNWRYLTYKVNFNFGATLFNLIDGDSVGYNFGYRTSTFYDVKRDKFIVSGFNFQKQDGVIYIQDNGDSNQYEIKTYTKPSYNSFRQGALFNGKYLSVGYSSINDAGQIWFVKTDTNGDIVWEKEYGTPEYDDGYSIEVSSDNYLYILGESRGYGPAKGFYTDALLIKTDSNGNELWRTTWGGYFNDCANNLAATPDGGVIACGSISEEFSNGNSNVAQGYVRKMDAKGNLVWDKTYPYKAPLQDGSPISFNVVRVLANENVLVVGSGYKINVDSSSFQTVPWAVIFDKNGKELMERAYTSLVGGYSSAEFQDIQPTADGGFIAGGTYYPSQGDTGNQDAFIVKLDERGCEFAECQPPLAVEEFSDASFQISVWPNPAQDILNMETDSPMEEIRVYNQLGSLVGSWQYSVGSVLELIDVSKLKPGLYFLVVKTENGVETRKFVKAN